MTKDEHKWIHPLALAVLDAVDAANEVPEAEKDMVSALKEASLIYTIIGNAHGPWDNGGRPLLSDEAKAVLNAAENAAKVCESCTSWEDGRCIDDDSPCCASHALIFKAMRGEKP